MILILFLFIYLFIIDVVWLGPLHPPKALPKHSFPYFSNFPFISPINTHCSLETLSYQLSFPLRRSLHSTFGFLGANPFYHPFFARPFDDITRRQVTIEELNRDDDDDDDGVKTTDSGKEIIPENPMQNTQGMERSFMYKKVAYGGPEGIYYTCSEGMMTGGDGVFLAEMKEEDKTIDESLHTISKGLRDKGHSMSTKRRRNGEKNSMQTLHNLNEDELSGFEEDWKSNAEKYFPGWGSGFNLLEDAGPNQNHHGWDGFSQLGWDGFPSWSGWALPSSSAYYGDFAETSVAANGNRPKKVVPVNID